MILLDRKLLCQPSKHKFQRPSTKPCWKNAGLPTEGIKVLFQRVSSELENISHPRKHIQGSLGLRAKEGEHTVWLCGEASLPRAEVEGTQNDTTVIVCPALRCLGEQSTLQSLFSDSGVSGSKVKMHFSCCIVFFFWFHDTPRLSAFRWLNKLHLLDSNKDKLQAKSPSPRSTKFLNFYQV